MRGMAAEEHQMVAVEEHHRELAEVHHKEPAEVLLEEPEVEPAEPEAELHHNTDRHHYYREFLFHSLNKT
jgi:hypothetical protein